MGATNSNALRPPIPKDDSHFLGQIGFSGWDKSKSKNNEAKTELVYVQKTWHPNPSKLGCGRYHRVNRAKNQRNFMAEMGMPALRAVIYSSYQISHRNMGKYVKRAEAAGLKWPMSEELSDDQLYKQLFLRIHCPTLEPYMFRTCQNVHLELRKKRVTLRLLWTEYLEKYPQGYGYSQFYRDWTRKVQSTVPQTLTQTLPQTLIEQEER